MLREQIETGIDSAYPHETREQWKSRIYNHVLRLIANDIGRIDITEPLVTVTGFNDNYITGAKEEHAYIVEYLRGLLDN